MQNRIEHSILTKGCSIVATLTLVTSMVPSTALTAFAEAPDTLNEQSVPVEQVETDAKAGAVAEASLPAASEVVLASQNTSVWDGTSDTSWYNTTDTTFHISTAAQLAGLVEITSPKVGSYDQWATGTHDSRAEGIAQDNFKGKTVILDADLDLSGYEANGTTENLLWVPICDLNNWGAGGAGVSTGTFDGVGWEGTFDGNGHVISNMRVNGGVHCAQNFGGYQGLFASIRNGGVIKNVGISSGSVYGRVSGGIVAISNLDVDENGNYIAPANQAEWPLVENCWTNLKVTGNGSGTRPSGGIFGGEGARNSWCSIINCYVRGDTANGETAGGVAGFCNGIIAGCYNTGTIPSNLNRGSIVATLQTIVAGDAGKIYRNDLEHLFVNNMALEGSCSIFYRYGNAASTAPKAVTTGFSTAEELKAGASTLGSGYVTDAGNENDGYPILFWQNGGTTTDISSAVVSAIPDQEYMKGEIQPDVTVTLDGKTLTYGTDYIVSYDNNIDIGDKTASATVIGVGAYTGKCNPVKFSITSTSVTYFTIDDIAAQWRYGEEVKPDVTVRNAAGTIVSEGVDYDLIWANNDAAGTATVTVCEVGDPTKLGGSASFKIFDASSSLAGSGTETDPWQVANRYDLQFLAYKVNSNDSAYVNSFVKLTDDVDTTHAEGELDNDTIGTVGTLRSTGELVYRSFLGTFDGDGHSVNLAWSDHENSARIDGDEITPTSSTAMGLFGNVEISGGDYSQTVTIKNLTTTGQIVYTDALSLSHRIGAIIGQSSGVKLNLTNLTNKATVTNAQQYAAGIIGYSAAELTAKNCTNAGDVTASSAAGGFTACLCGYSASETSYGTNTLEDCTNSGKIVSTGSSAAGLVATSSFQGYSQNTFTRCSNTGDIESIGDMGGILGGSGASGSKGDFTMEFCFNSGSVTQTGTRRAVNVGGLISVMPYGKCAIIDCYNTGDVTNKSTITNLYYFTGGLIGKDRSSSSAVGDRVVSGYNAGTVKAVLTHGSYNAAGAVIGDVKAGGSKLAVTSTYDVIYKEGCVVGLSGNAPETTPSIGFNESDGTTVVVNDNCVSKTDEFMKSSEMLTLLNGETGDAFVADGTETLSINKGYPILSWQLGFYKDEAKRAVSEEAISASDKIDALSNLTEGEKTSVKGEIETAKNDAIAAIDNATGKDAVEKAKADGVKAIEDKLKAAEERDAEIALNNAKTDAKKSVSDRKEANKAEIAKLVNLSESEKADFETQADNACAAAMANIDACTKVSDVDTAKTNGVAAVDGALSDAQARDEENLVACKLDAGLKIDAAISGFDEFVDGLVNLTAQQKQGYKDTVDVAGAAAKNEIESSVVTKEVDAIWLNFSSVVQASYSKAEAENVNNRVKVYRLYNAATAEHIWTTDANEYNVLPTYGWSQEGVCWSCNKAGKPVYRLYSPGLGVHHYTADENEVSVLSSLYGWTYEGVSFYALDDEPEGSIDIYRLYNDGLSQHLLTTDANEVSVLSTNFGWTAEGVAFRVYKG